MWPPHRAARRVALDLFPGDVDAVGPHEVDDPLGAPEPRLPHASHLRFQTGMSRVHVVREQVQRDRRLDAVPPAGQFDSRYEVKAEPAGLVLRLTPTGDAVVIRERDNIERRGGRGLDHLGRRQRPVGDGRVGVQVDAHRPPTLPDHPEPWDDLLRGARRGDGRQLLGPADLVKVDAEQPAG